MRATELITQIQDAVEKYGDLEVGVFNDELCQYEELLKVTGKVSVSHEGVGFKTDGELLDDEFIAMKKICE